MCSSRLKRSFRIEDILSNKPKTDHAYKTNDNKAANNSRNVSERQIVYPNDFHYNKSANHALDSNNDRTKTVLQFNQKHQIKKNVETPINTTDIMYNNSRIPSLTNIQEKRQSCPNMPVVPTPLKPEVLWGCQSFLKPTCPSLDPRGSFNFFSESLHPEPFLRNSLLSRRCSIPPTLGYPPYTFDRGGFHGYWPSYLGYLPALAKRKGGQVRFTSQQTSSLERRFAANKYLSPEDRRLLAQQLKLSDRQVKTWFQNRRAKWRRGNGGGDSDQEAEDISDEEFSSGEGKDTLNGRCKPEAAPRTYV